MINQELRSNGIGGRVFFEWRSCQRCGTEFPVYVDHKKQKHCSYRCANSRQGDAGMQNLVEIRGDEAVIFIPRKGQILECLIDAADLPLIRSVGRTWHGRWAPDSKTFYAVCHRPGHRGKCIQMHGLILGATASEQVDHIHHNGLDNRRSQIRIASACLNQFNRRKFKKSRSSQRGVSWYSRQQRWVVRFTINKKTRSLGFFKSQEEAESVARGFLEGHEWLSIKS